ncbi:hypothetical protein O181_048822 [Austropuccinia psidii MF-1]|uniref:Uncharacterized protein n=1 Tax=Austropuccinia psidii MF-1 TaxID=1389203 RepID=A0A9Q3DVT1_9BASI|nr:hypothetical protein [Austropuccinia psidii MF-1]
MRNLMPISLSELLFLVLIPSSLTGDVEKSTNPNNSLQIFQFERKWSWSNNQFEVQEVGGNMTLNVETKLGDKDSGIFRLTITGGTVDQKLDVNIRGNVINCGHSQTYKISTGIHLSGDIEEASTKKTVAHFHAEEPSGHRTCDYRIDTNNDIAIENLAALYISAIIRADICPL